MGAGAAIILLGLGVGIICSMIFVFESRRIDRQMRARIEDARLQRESVAKYGREDPLLREIKC